VRGSLGQILVQQGVVDASALSDALARQGSRHRLASELYMLGYASERQLCLALSLKRTPHLRFTRVRHGAGDLS